MVGASLPPPPPRLRLTTLPHIHTQAGQRTAAANLARDLQLRLADLVRVSQQLDGAWRMHAVREASGSGRDVWKR
jgi:hypothetical protein